MLKEVVSVLFFRITESHPHLFHNLGGFSAVLRTVDSESSVYKLATIGLTGTSWLLALTACGSRSVLGVRSMYYVEGTLEVV